MFESGLSEADAEATIAAAEDNERVAVEVETRRLWIALRWADLHPGDAVDPDGPPGRQRAVLVGGAGTPEVADFCFASLGTALRSTAVSAARLIGDALDLRHRLPGTWAAVRAGEVPVFQARRVASATRALTEQQAGRVDARVAPRLGRVSFGRLQTLLEAYVYEADPEGADAAAEQAARERFVRLGRTSEHGLRFIMARITAGDAAWGDALTSRLAEILRLEGDLDSLDVRRSKAFGLQLSQPAEVLRLLCAHQHDDDDDQDDEPDPACPDAAEGPGAEEPQDAEDASPEPLEGPGAEDASPEPVEAAEPQEPQDAFPEPVEGPGAEDAFPEPVEGPEPRDVTQLDPSTSSGHEVEDAGRRSLRMVPPPFDPARARPRAIVYVHLSEAALSAGRGIARVEEVGPVLVSRLGDLIGDRSQIILKPVIDLNEVPAPIDSYEIPDVLREHLLLRQPVDVFPYAAGGHRSMDLDHTLAYMPPEHGGPPGQTAVGKLGPLARYHHRVKTHGEWRVRQPEPGVWVWRSPEGRVFLVNQTGTHALGHSGYAQQIWRAAKAPPADLEESPLGSRAELIARADLDAYTLAG